MWGGGNMVQKGKGGKARCGMVWYGRKGEGTGGDGMGWEGKGPKGADGDGDGDGAVCAGGGGDMVQKGKGEKARCGMVWYGTKRGGGRERVGDRGWFETRRNGRGGGAVGDRGK